MGEPTIGYLLRNTARQGWGGWVILSSHSMVFDPSTYRRRARTMDAVLKDLIIKAFEKAKSSGKPDWQRMTVAVLKNRLIQLTQGAFRETEYGSRSVLELVELAGEIVKLDKTQLPPIVELIVAQDVQETPAPYYASFDRIRPDLWQAIMDYSSGNQYVWDVKQSAARPRAADDPPELLMPTIKADIDVKWRKEFVGKYADEVSDFEKGRMKVFVENGMSPKVLPHTVLIKWNEFIKARVLERLAKWFEDRKVGPPERLVVSVRRPPRFKRQDEVEQLRELIVACVKGMTPQELATVTLPPFALLRAKRDKSGT